MAPKCYARHQHLVPGDAIFELRRARARVGSKPDGVKWLRLLEGKGRIDEVYKNMLLSLLTMDIKPDPHEVKIDADDVVELRERPMPLKNRKRNYSFIDDRGKARISEKNKALVPLDNDHLHHKNRLVQFHSDHVARAQPVKIHRGKIGGKFKGVVKEEYEAKKNTVVKKENEKTYQDRGSRRRNLGSRNYCQDVGRVRGQTELMKVVGGDKGLSSKKTAFGNCGVKNKKEPAEPIKGIPSQIRNVKRAKYSFTYNSDEKYLEGEGSSKTVPEVIILDSDKVVKKEIVSPFVCSKKYHSSMADEGSKKRGCPSAIDNEFRKELLKVLRKPYDREEYQKSRDAIRAGSYLDYHPDVQRQLTKYRYKRDKCLIIVRGFLFWLQNLSREGVFQPWKDKQCLELELPSR